MRRLPLLLCTLIFGLASGPPLVRAEEVVEETDDGTVRARYEVDEQGRMNGAFEAFHENGETALKATYKDDRLHGTERRWNESGVLRSVLTYRKGVLHGTQKTYDERGRPTAQWNTKNGTLHGPNKRFHPNRRLHIVTTYRDGKRHGKYQELEPDGATRILAKYHEGRLHGTYEAFEGKRCLTKQKWAHGVVLEIDGANPFPRTQAAIQSELERIIAGAGALPAGELDADRELALRQLKAYRYLVGVPYDDLRLDAYCNEHAQAGAEICAALRQITHTPTNPGWPSGRFNKASIGAGASNLHRGHRACTSVRGYMDDSDPTNIARLGHRSWCMNPEMLKTGFGHHEGFTAMWATDDSRPKVPDYDFVSVPPRGHVPDAWVGSHWAWSLSLNPRHFDAPIKENVRARVEPIGDDFLPSGAPLPIGYANTTHDARGIPYLVVFRPTDISIRAGKRYRVTIEGLTRKGKPKPVRYFVAFFDHPYPRPRVPQAK